MLFHTVYSNPQTRKWVTFIHGAGGSSSIWFKQIREFKKHANVLLIDLRGHGRSKNIKYENLKFYTFDSIGDDVVEVLNHNQIEKSHFVGISLGTIIIREIADRYPERVASMILGGAIMKFNLRGKFLMQIGVMLKSVIPYLLLYRFFAFIIMPRKKHKESRLLFINEAKKLYQKEFIRWFTLTSKIHSMLKFFRINPNAIPTLYVMGQEDYMFLPSIRELIKTHTSSILHIIPDCGHVVNVEKPEIFNSITLDFINNQS